MAQTSPSPMSARVLYLCVRLSQDHLFQNSHRDCGGIRRRGKLAAGLRSGWATKSGRNPRSATTPLFSSRCCWRMCYKQNYKNVTTAEAPDLSLPITPCSALVRAIVIHSPTTSVADLEITLSSKALSQLGFKNRLVAKPRN